MENIVIYKNKWSNQLQNLFINMTECMFAYDDA